MSLDLPQDFSNGVRNFHACKCERAKIIWDKMELHSHNISLTCTNQEQTGKYLALFTA
jgi:hypothetical protein